MGAADHVWDLLMEAKTQLPTVMCFALKDDKMDSGVLDG